MLAWKGRLSVDTKNPDLRGWILKSGLSASFVARRQGGKPAYTLRIGALCSARQSGMAQPFEHINR
jgi:hypothetical protein